MLRISLKTQLMPFFMLSIWQEDMTRIIILHVIPSIPLNVPLYAPFTARKEDIELIKKGLQDFCKKMETQIGTPAVNLCPKSSFPRAIQWKRF